ncbi:uncharacterized protein LOC106171474 [Lingula anatina]|uniref:Uncharacterized protein LOC106171474 n=1 Tax=Lingula anatina TaxID=7574 RepID=A0A1S3JBP0_LINAN|nr:uncharacterized protein LOC106171474 [Lingula anatina]|eukprot:XP_013407299.1 uncharacterized protein LOC106171474 [Lingula anatina]
MREQKSNIISVLLLAILLLYTGLVCSKTSEGRYHVFKNSRFDGNIIKTLTSWSMTQCTVKCSGTPDCYGVNYNSASHECELYSNVGPHHLEGGLSTWSNGVREICDVPYGPFGGAGGNRFSDLDYAYKGHITGFDLQYGHDGIYSIRFVYGGVGTSIRGQTPGTPVSVVLSNNEFIHTVRVTEYQGVYLLVGSIALVTNTACYGPYGIETSPVSGKRIFFAIFNVMVNFVHLNGYNAYNTKCVQLLSMVDK